MIRGRLRFHRYLRCNPHTCHRAHEPIFLAEYRPPVGTVPSPEVGSTFIDALLFVLFCLTEATSKDIFSPAAVCP
jgi:hypothetical protein